MATGTGRTRECDSATRTGRLHKARQFMDAANTIETLADDAADVADAYVTMCVHAGIAAADVICCARLGQHARGEDHVSAIRLLDQAGPDEAKHLRALLGLRSGPYRHETGAARLIPGAVSLRAWTAPDAPRRRATTRLRAPRRRATTGSIGSVSGPLAVPLRADPFPAVIDCGPWRSHRFVRTRVPAPRRARTRPRSSRA